VTLAEARVDTVWFRSKLDGVLAVLLTLPPISAVLALVGAVRDGRPLHGLVPIALLLAVYGLFLFPVGYVLDGGWLTVRTGVLRARVPLARIRSVRPTHAPWSAAALSLDRFEIRWGDGRFERTLVSPAERDRFLDELQARTSLTRDGDTLVAPTPDPPSPVQ
jgi:hypothetical protein